jgi:hypothetical protein
MTILPDFADLADIDLAECAFALELEAMVAGHNRSKLEVLATRIGLSRDATAKVLGDWERRAQLMHAAHELVMRLLAAAREGRTAFPMVAHPTPVIRQAAGLLLAPPTFRRQPQ